MSTENHSKINRLLYANPAGIVFTSHWLSEQGYSSELQRRYRKSGWLESIGTGAMVRVGDRVGYEGAIYALQNQAGKFIHPAGKTALSMLGKAHYLEMGRSSITLFGDKEGLPTWFKNYDWGMDMRYYTSNFLPVDMALTDIELKNFSIKISSPARAILECLYLVPHEQSLVECFELMEGLNNLRPDVIQGLLEQCTSVKVKRLFLYLAEKAGHAWFQYIKTDNITLGSGKRSIIRNGIYIPKYQITVSKELEENGTSGI